MTAKFCARQPTGRPLTCGSLCGPRAALHFFRVKRFMLTSSASLRRTYSPTYRYPALYAAHATILRISAAPDQRRLSHPDTTSFGSTTSEMPFAPLITSCEKPMASFTVMPYLRRYPRRPFKSNCEAFRKHPAPMAAARDGAPLLRPSIEPRERRHAATALFQSRFVFCRFTSRRVASAKSYLELRCDDFPR